MSAELLEAFDSIKRKPVPVDASSPVALPTDFDLKSLEFLRANPDRPRGEVEFQTLISLLEYGDRHAIAGSTAVFADRDGIINVVANWHDRETTAGWGDHRAFYKLVFSPQWLAWSGINGKPLGQRAFGEFLEERAVDDVIEPSPAALLEAVLKLSGKRNITFESSAKLDNGDVSIVWKEETTTGNQQGNGKFPSKFTLRLPVYRGAEHATTFDVNALLRYRIDEGKLAFEVKLLQIENIRELAFTELLASIQGSVNAWDVEKVPVYVGKITTAPKPQ